MKKDVIDILCCPDCKGSLSVEIESEKDDEIVNGILKCSNCEKKYTINQGIADLRPK